MWEMWTKYSYTHVYEIRTQTRHITTDTVESKTHNAEIPTPVTSNCPKISI